jgi:hypothetical protein
MTITNAISPHGRLTTGIDSDGADAAGAGVRDALGGMLAGVGVRDTLGGMLAGACIAPGRCGAVATMLGWADAYAAGGNDPGAGLGNGASSAILTVGATRGASLPGMRAPHPPQNRESGALSVPQLGQRIPLAA